MSYEIRFAGLVCFSRFGDGLNVFLPDGHAERHAHIAAIIARSGTVIGSEWQKVETDEAVIFTIENRTTLAFSGSTPPGKINLNHYGYLPNLRRLDEDGGFRLSDEPETIATTRLRNGTLTVFEHPHEGGEAFVSTFVVPHDEWIRITASDGRIIVLKPGTEIAVVNVEREYLEAVINGVGYNRTAGSEWEHFQIYYKLAAPDRGSRLSLPERTGRPKLSTDHPAFGDPDRGRTLKIGCSNTGCC